MSEVSNKIFIELEITNLEEVKKEISEIIKKVKDLRFKVKSEIVWEENNA